MKPKTCTCISKHNGQPLSRFVSVRDASEQAWLIQLLNAHIKLVPYRCNRCDYWHLCPEDRYTPNTTCHYCLDHDGKPKKLYLTYKSAKTRAQIIFEEREQQLFIYPCPYQTGFHLTKSGYYRGV